MKPTTCRLAALFFTAAPALAAAPADDPGPNSYHYQPRRTIIGYPPLPLRDDQRPQLTSTDDVKHRIRMAHFEFGHITEEWADEKIRWAKQKGFTHILAERNRYLFYEAGGKANIPGARSYPKTLDELISTSKMMADACHRHGLKFIHHLTCTMVNEDYLAKHPDHASIDMRTRAGFATGYNTLAACVANRDFQREFLRRLGRLVRESGADGLMLDEVCFWRHTACACGPCRRRFTGETGYELPQKYAPGFLANLENPAYMRWLKWREDQVSEFNAKITGLVRKYGGLRYKYRSAQSLFRYVYLRMAWTFEDAIEHSDVFGYECEPAGYRECGYLYLWPLAVCEMKVLRAVADHLDAAPWTLFYPYSLDDYTWNWLMAMSQGSRLWWRSADKRAVSSWEPLINWEQ